MQLKEILKNPAQMQILLLITPRIHGKPKFSPNNSKNPFHQTIVKEFSPNNSENPFLKTRILHGFDHDGIEMTEHRKTQLMQLLKGSALMQ